MFLHILNIFKDSLQVVHILWPAFTTFYPLPTTDEKFHPLIERTKKSFAGNKSPMNMMNLSALNIVILKYHFCDNHHINPPENPTYICWIYHFKAVHLFQRLNKCWQIILSGSNSLIDILLLPFFNHCFSFFHFYP